MPSGNSNMQAHLIGVTNIVVGLSQTVEVTPPAGTVNGFITIAAGGATCEVVNGVSNVVGEGHYLRANERMELEGPAQFWLAAAGATMTISLVTRKSAGSSNNG